MQILSKEEYFPLHDTRESIGKELADLSLSGVLCLTLLLILSWCHANDFKEGFTVIAAAGKTGKLCNLGNGLITLSKPGQTLMDSLGIDVMDRCLMKELFE